MRREVKGEIESIIRVVDGSNVPAVLILLCYLEKILKSHCNADSHDQDGMSAGVV
jgi:hypothetical protein